MSDVVEVISKLGIDAEGVFKTLDQVNEKYGQTTANIRKQKNELAELQKFEEGLQKERAKTNNPSVVAQFNNEITKTQGKIKELTKAIQDESKALGDTNKEATKLKTGLDKAFDGTKAKSLKAQLRELKAQLAETDDDHEFNKLAIEAGKLEDKIGDASTAARIFASDSKFEIIGNAVGNLGQKLLALDFDGAVQGSQLLLKASQQITFKDAIGAIKQIGTVLANVGQALLTNPLFLIGATIALLIKGFDDLTASMDAGTKSLEDNAEAVKKVRDATDDLIRANRDLQLQNEIDAGKISKLNGDKIKNQNKFKDEYVAILRSQREQEAKFNADIQKEREDDGFRRSKQLFEALGGETELTARQKIGLRDIETAHNEQIEALKKKFGLENEKILIEQANAEAKANDELAKRALEKAKAQSKKLRDLEVANIKDDIARRRAELTVKFNDEVEAANGNAAIIRELNTKLANDLAAIDKELADKERAAIDAELQKREDAVLKEVQLELEKKKKIQAIKEDQLAEAQRHSQTLLEIQTAGQKNQQAILLANEIAYERQRLGLIGQYYGFESDEYQKQKNKLEELEARYQQEIGKMRKKEITDAIANYKQLIDAAVKAGQQILAAEISKVDRLISLQQRRVDEMAKIAENGNAELLQLEKERLDKLNKQKEDFVRKQQELALIELTANTIVTVSKAAAEGGAGAAFTIAAALIALAAGLASARSIASEASFYEGGEYDGQGYTGDGNPREVSHAVGRKPYEYHRQEFVHNHQTTRKYRKIFQDVHEGKVDLNQMKFESDMYKMLHARGINTSAEFGYNNTQQSVDISKLTSEMREVREAIKSQSRLKLNIDRHGISIIATEYMRRQSKIDAIT